MIVLYLTVIVLVSYYAYFRHGRRRYYELANQANEICSLPIIGAVHNFIGGPEKNWDGLRKVGNKTNDVGGIAKLWLGTRLYIIITNPADAQLVLENCLEKDMVYKFLKPWLGNGLFVAPVDLWKVHRKVLVSAFHNRIVENYIDVFGEQSNLLTKVLQRKIGKGSFDIFPYITACTIDIVFETAMGERMDMQNSGESTYLRARSTVMSIISMRLFKVWLQPDSLFNLSPYAKQQKTNIDITHAFADGVIKRKREIANYKNNNAEPQIEDPKEAANPKNHSLLDILLEKDINFTDEQLREHIDSITIAGNDTTALVIAYALVLLGSHQDAQDKVFEELQSIFGCSKRIATKEDLFEMHYLERVIKETMRLYTVVPIIARTTNKEIELSKCTVPEGAGCVIAAFAMHRSEAIWGPNVNNFDPDRFLPENSSKRHPCAHVPFSFGTRNCIGRHFAMLAMKSILANVLRSYKVIAEDCKRFKVEILLLPTDGHVVSLEKR